MHTASLAVPCTDPDEARVLHQALEVETRDGPEGSTVTLRVQDATIAIEVEAPDTSTLRAALNSVLRLLDAAQRVARGQ